VANLFQETLFFILSGMAVLSAAMMVLLNNPVRCALSLVLAFVASSGLWLLAQAEFLALVLVLVYVGAVMTLFLFVIMMLDIEKLTGKSHFVRYLPISLAIAGLLVILMIQALKPEYLAAFQVSSAAGAAIADNIGNTERLGLVLYTVYAYPLEIAAVLLLIAIISAIILAHRPPRTSRVQKLQEQLAANKANRLTIVKMSAHEIK